MSAPTALDRMISVARALAAMPTLRRAYISLDALSWQDGKERVGGVSLSFPAGDTLGLDAAVSLLEPIPFDLGRLDFVSDGVALASKTGKFDGVRVAVTGSRADMDAVDGVESAPAGPAYDEAPVKSRSVA